VEFWGPGLPNLPLADRATIGNMSPEMGATCAIFPVDAETLRYLEFSGRPKERLELVEAYCKEQGLFHDENSEEATYSDTLELDLGDVEPSLAGPKRPQDRVALTNAAADFRSELEEYAGKEVHTGYDEAIDESFPSSDPPTNNGGGESPKGAHGHPQPEHSHPQPGTAVAEREEGFGHGSVVIAAITSCTNTSNPSVMIGAGLLAKKAVEAGLERMPWVKTSLAPGSKVVTEYLERADLLEPLSKLGFDLVGYGCTTCIGNSGPLPEEVSKEIEERDLIVASVLSGNRNFEGRIHPEVKMNYLASPPLCVAYALAGRMDLDITSEPLQNDVHLRDIWPSQQEVNEAIEQAIESEMFHKSYGDALFEGDDNWKELDIPEGDRYQWDDESTYVKRPPYFEDMPDEAPEGFEEIKGAKALAILGDSVTTDHISPAGAIKKDSPAGEYLIDHGVEQKQFNSYGSRRGNHEVMVRGTFANIRLRNLLAPDTEGGFTTKDGDVKPIYDAALEYHEEGTPLCVIAGKEYGSGSSRDWAAKGPRLLGVRFVLAESYERIHRSNLVGMGILPLQFPDGESAESLGIDGEETFDLEPLEEGAKTLKVTTSGGKDFEARVRIDTPNEWLYYRHDGILHYVLRDLRSD
jgi:aconitate hydratase